MKRILIAAVLGGVIIFVWGALSHMVLQVGSMGMSQLPDEGPVIEALRTHVPEAGMYMYPGWDDAVAKSAAEEASWMKQYATGPAGLLIHRPKGGEFMPPSVLLSEVISNVFAALIAALIASSLAGGFGKRVLMLTLLGVFAWVTVNVSYWAWYHFPMVFVLGEALDIVVSTFLAALVIAKLVPAPERRVA